MSRWIVAALVSGLAAAFGHCPAALAQTPITRLSCKGAILGFEQLGDHRLATYQDAYGHHIELWCTRRIFDSQFDLRVALNAPVQTAAGKRDAAASDPLATVGGCFFDNGDNDGPIIVNAPGGAYTRVEWTTATPSHRRQYRFSYDFATDKVTITATVRGCPAVSKIVAPQPSYKNLAALLPHPESQPCAQNALGTADQPTPAP